MSQYPVEGWDVPRDYYAPDEPCADEESFMAMVDERMERDCDEHDPGTRHMVSDLDLAPMPQATARAVCPQHGRSKSRSL